MGIKITRSLACLSLGLTAAVIGLTGCTANPEKNKPATTPTVVATPTITVDPTATATPSITASPTQTARSPQGQYVSTRNHYGNIGHNSIVENKSLKTIANEIKTASGMNLHETKDAADFVKHGLNHGNITEKIVFKGTGNNSDSLILIKVDDAKSMDVFERNLRNSKLMNKTSGTMRINNVNAPASHTGNQAVVERSGNIIMYAVTNDPVKITSAFKRACNDSRNTANTANTGFTGINGINNINAPARRSAVTSTTSGNYNNYPNTANGINTSNNATTATKNYGSNVNY